MCSGVPKKQMRIRSAAEPAPPYLTSRTTLLFTCTSCPRWGTSKCSLVGSSLEPAAGSTSPSASTRPRAVCICFFAPRGFTQCVRVELCLLASMGVFVVLCGALWCLFGTSGSLGDSLVAPWVSILTHMGYRWESFGHFGETLGLHFGTRGLHLGTLGVHVGVLWALWGVARDPSGHFCGKGSKKVPKIHVKIETFPMFFEFV